MGWILRNFNSRDRSILKPLWKRLVQQHIDYCSPLWFSPEDGKSLHNIENLQRRFTPKISALADMNYWQRLKSLNIYSQERRLERYRIIYTWKAIENHIPNCGLNTHYSDRRGRSVIIKPIITSCPMRIRSIREGSFFINGPKLFNSLPSVRNLTNCSVSTFKSKLDEYLSFVPDEPHCDNLKPSSINQMTGRFSNSIIDHSHNHSLALRPFI